MLNLPQLTAYIGKNANVGGNNEFSSLIKGLKVKLKEEDLPYTVFLVFDLQNKEINFEVKDEFKEKHLDEYYYFGNNSAAAAQYYLVRESNSLKYLLGKVWTDLYQTLSRYNLQDREMGQLLKKLADQSYIFINKKDGWGINPDKLTIIKEQPQLEVELLSNSVKIKASEQEEKKLNYESFIRLFIKDENKHNRFVLVVPVVKMESGEEVVLSTHKDYLELVKLVNNLGPSSSEKKPGEKEKVCYLCGRTRTDVSSKYSKKFSRSGINKIFTTTTINTSPYLRDFNYDYVYATCQECYQKLLAGEKIISERFKGRIAGEDVFIIPEGLFGNFDYNHLYKLKKDIDLAFQISKADEWLQQLETGAMVDNLNQYALNFIFYRSDGNSVTILETIEDVPVLRFQRILEKLAEEAFKLQAHLRSMSIGHIYRIIPVRINRQGEQLDIGRVLSFYKALLNGEQVKAGNLFSYAVEALDKGLRQLSKEKIDNFINLNLRRYQNGYEDFYIKNIIMRYLVLIHTCQGFGILDKKVFGGGERMNEEITTGSEKVDSAIKNMEAFLYRQGLCPEARALFYVGVLLYRVALAQWFKEHKKKPVLKKVHFQGMNQKEVYQLYNDLLEKLRQYNRWSLFSEAVMNRFHHYYSGNLERKWPLSEQANVFYIMSGYAYMVGTKAPDLTPEEEKAQEDIVPEEN
jgi:CRISPR-associated protein Csh1